MDFFYIGTFRHVLNKGGQPIEYEMIDNKFLCYKNGKRN